MSEVLSVELLEEAVEAIERLRAEGGHLHSVTNTVAQNFSANVLLACGASVAMTANAPEMQEFVSRADALHINLGTLDEGRIAAIEAAIAAAKEKSIPILIDPVMIEASSLRKAFAEKLMVDATIIRCNQTEAERLADFAHGSQCKVITGAIDQIVWNEHIVSVENGSPMLASTIATGCALGALIAVLASKTTNPAAASVAGLLWFNIAGELAAKQCAGPGSFAVALIDQLQTLTPQQIRSNARMK